eukprot:UN13104
MKNKMIYSANLFQRFCSAEYFKFKKKSVKAAGVCKCCHI